MMQTTKAQLMKIARPLSAGLLSAALLVGLTGIAGSGLGSPVIANVTSNVTSALSYHADPLFPIALAAERRIEIEEAAATAARERAAAAAAAKPAVTLQANQFAFPSLGIGTKHVYDFTCDSSAKLLDRLYYWGCSGTNNVYMLGHAYGIFKPLRTAYLNGTLTVGMVAYYAGADGVTREYHVTEVRRERIALWSKWKDWAAGDLSAPSITLQTCDNPSDSYRILVRLVAV